MKIGHGNIRFSVDELTDLVLDMELYRLVELKDVFYHRYQKVENPKFISEIPILEELTNRLDQEVNKDEEADRRKHLLKLVSEEKAKGLIN